MNQHDVGVIKKIVQAELKEFGRTVDGEFNPNFEEIKNALDGANKNIFKLQAQVTALKKLLIERGIIAEETFNVASGEALEALVKLSHSSKTSGTDSGRAETHTSDSETSTIPQGSGKKEEVNA